MDEFNQLLHSWFAFLQPSDVMINLWREQKESVGASPIVHGLERYPPRE